jgi:hypothetical protein
MAGTNANTVRRKIRYVIRFKSIYLLTLFMLPKEQKCYLKYESGLLSLSCNYGKNSLYLMPANQTPSQTAFPMPADHIFMLTTTSIKT